MKISANTHVDYPLDLVFRTYRDDLDKLVPFLPNIESIEVKERVEGADGNPSLVRLLNVWRGKANIPSMARGFIKPEMLAWDDYATWDERTHSCEWRSESHSFGGRTSCSGTTRLIEDGGGTRLEIRGDFTLNLKGMRGVPRLLTGAATKAAETFIVTLLAPNLASISTGLDGYLKGQPSGS